MVTPHRDPASVGAGAGSPGDRTPAVRAQEAASPIIGDEPDQIEAGLALCLSGGGYRAMLFHVGALIRLNELGYLGRINRFSSVSGGSITAGVLGMNWSRLRFDGQPMASNLDELLVRPIRALAGTTIDKPTILGGLLTPGRTISESLIGAYRKHLFARATLQALPSDPPGPRFVMNATSVQTGALWRFSKPYMADYKVGMIYDPDVELAVAVAASSAFPPVLSPLRLALDPSTFSQEGRGPLHEPPYTTNAVLTDGGVYDNLGLETAWKRYSTILISDGGGQMQPEPAPHGDWTRHAMRITSVIDNQVRDLRKRQAISSFLSGERQGAYWGIRSHVADFGPPPGSLACPPALTLRLAQTPTRLRAMDDVLQERLINWGYAICDVAIRRWVDPSAAPPGGFPYPPAAVG
jgi:NTE family protein